MIKILKKMGTLMVVMGLIGYLEVIVVYWTIDSFAPQLMAKLKTFISKINMDIKPVGMLITTLVLGYGTVYLYYRIRAMIGRGIKRN